MLLLPQYLNNIYDIAPVGFGLSFLRWTDANSFIILYALIAYYFSNRMARLVILLGPVASALGGICIGFCFDQFILHPIGRILATTLLGKPTLSDDDDDAPAPAEAAASADDKTPAAKAAKAANGDGDIKAKNAKLQEYISRKGRGIAKAAWTMYNFRLTCLLRIALGVYLVKQTRWPLYKKVSGLRDLALALHWPSTDLLLIFHSPCTPLSLTFHHSPLLTFTHLPRTFYSLPPGQGVPQVLS